MKIPKRRLLLLAICFQGLFFSACQTTPEVVVTHYSSQYLTFEGSAEDFHNACRKVMHDLSYKEVIDENKTRYPYYGEGASSHTVDGRKVAVKRYRKTKDEAGASYKITTLELGDQQPVVILESTAEDRNKLVNSLYTEFHQRGFKVAAYQPD